MRIKIPKNPEELANLGIAVSAKHVALGDKSPLKDIEGIDDLGTLAADAKANHDLSKSLTEQAETATQARDNGLGQKGKMHPNTVKHLVTAAREVLAGQNKGNEHVLGDWGYGVVDSASTTSNPAKVAAKAAKKAAKVTKAAARAAAKVKPAA